MNVAFQTVQLQIADMERELLALSSNQAPAPRQISTFSHSVNLAVGINNFSVVFPAGTKLFQVYSSNATYFNVTVTGDDVTLQAFKPNNGTASSLTVVSLGEFSIV